MAFSLGIYPESAESLGIRESLERLKNVKQPVKPCCETLAVKHSGMRPDCETFSVKHILKYRYTFHLTRISGKNHLLGWDIPRGGEGVYVD